MKEKVLLQLSNMLSNRKRDMIFYMERIKNNIRSDADTSDAEEHLYSIIAEMTVFDEAYKIIKKAKDVEPFLEVAKERVVYLARTPEKARTEQGRYLMRCKLAAWALLVTVIEECKVK